MSATTCLYDPVLSLLRQYSHRRDLRHLKALAWMVTALVCSGRLSPCQSGKPMCRVVPVKRKALNDDGSGL